MVTTLNQLERRFQLILHCIPFVLEHLNLLEYRAAPSAGNPVSILRGIDKKCCSLISGSLFSECLFRLLHDFRTDST